MASGLGLSPVDAEMTNRMTIGMPFGPSDIAAVLDEWLHLSGCRLTFQWPVAWNQNPNKQPPPKVDFSTGDGLMPYLGVQIALAVARTDALYTCDACGHPFTPRRRPAEGRKAYCQREECQQNARWRNAAQRARDKAKNVNKEGSE